MAYSLRNHIKKLASPRNLSPLCISRNEMKSPLSHNIQSFQSFCTPERNSTKNILRVPESSHNATRSPITGICFSHSRICAARKLELGSECASSPRTINQNLSCELEKKNEDDGDRFELLDTPKKIALSTHGLNSRKHWVKIGKGSFGTVIQVKYKGKRMAVKVIPKGRFRKSLVSLKNESNAIKLSHRNVVKVLQVTVTEGDYGLVFMELCSGQNLQAMISNPTISMNSLQRTRYALDIALALNHCHSNNVLHLDVKPSNVMVCSLGDCCKLCDFGSSHIFGKEECYTVTPSMNTVLYTDPDILQGKSPSEKSDIYSLGITLWQLMSREVPYEEYTLHTIIYKVGSGKLRPSSVQDVEFQDEDFVNLYKLCWQQNPVNRPTTSTIIQELTKMITLLKNLSTLPG